MRDMLPILVTRKPRGSQTLIFVWASQLMSGRCLPNSPLVLGAAAAYTGPNTGALNKSCRKSRPQTKKAGGASPEDCKDLLYQILGEILVKSSEACLEGKFLPAFIHLQCLVPLCACELCTTDVFCTIMGACRGVKRILPQFPLRWTYLCCFAV